MLYHRVPTAMKGDTLYPLNELRQVYPEAYAEAVKKYAGREHLLDRKVPGLNCLWNDVLHLAPVHPQKIRQAQYELGLKWTAGRFFAVDPSLLDPKLAVIYLYSRFQPYQEPSHDEFTPYRPELVNRYTELPQATIDYYHEAVATGKPVLSYHLVPHILYKGTLDISRLEIIEIST